MSQTNGLGYTYKKLSMHIIILFIRLSTYLLIHLSTIIQLMLKFFGYKSLKFKNIFKL